ncbi:uncharacterized protein DUF2334 [Pontibacter ummariensis]|uniref:Polysaccharide deacetylase n=1 Tax=Pontibacter ummariensis TaxID=1610492 RepID=A0A239EN10_9BACT|nr:DUF2334 domain-containing protein [Pontibacter ummariensis]PRY13315.1 uncharacterized protein DUF2334 [Pontibacter ummariensis]SNS45264.1 hypothetical protein SAMN06296052_106230 [Pontibacter ummariensis]
MINWLPEGKKAAICFTIDDIHPAKSTDYYEAGGDLEKGSLGLVQWLLERHPKLKVTLFTTADWREISPVPTRKLLASIPQLRDQFYLAALWEKGTMRLDRHPEFVNFLNNMERTEIALHGLYHCHKGLKIPVEFQEQTEEEFQDILSEMIRIFDRAKLRYVKGICPPGWNAPDGLLNQLVAHNIRFINSARDIFTPVAKDAKTNMSGLKELPLIYPSLIQNDQLVHIPANFQATSTPDRARRILDNGGLLSIKAHIIKTAMGHVSLDGVDQTYMNYLDVLLTALEQEYGDDLWWTSMGGITDQIFAHEKIAA